MTGKHTWLVNNFTKQELKCLGKHMGCVIGRLPRRPQRSDESRNVCSCMAFPSCLLIVQRVDDTNHVFSRLFQFLYNKIVYKRCVFPVIPVIQGFRNYGKSVSGTFLKPLNNWISWRLGSRPITQPMCFPSHSNSFMVKSFTNNVFSQLFQLFQGFKQVPDTDLP